MTNPAQLPTLILQAESQSCFPGPKCFVAFVIYNPWLGHYDQDMKQITAEDINFCRWNLNVITSEIATFHTSEEIQRQALEAVELCSKALKSIIETGDQAEFEMNFNHAMGAFDRIIQQIQDQKEEQQMSLLLMTHVGDMLARFKGTGREKLQ